MPDISRVEEMQDDLIALVATINNTTTFRVKVNETFEKFVDISSVENMPAVAVVLGDETFQGTGNKHGDRWLRHIFDSYVNVSFIGYCMQSDAEALLHELKKIVATNAIANVNDSTNKWYIVGEPMTVYRDPFPNERGRVHVGVAFLVRVLAQVKTTL